MATIPTLPITAHRDITTTYIKMSQADVLYTNFRTSSLLTKTSSDTLTASVCSLTADYSAADSNSSYHTLTRMTMLHYNTLDALTGLQTQLGIMTVRKRFMDQKITPGTLTATVSGGAFVGDFYDSGSGEWIWSNDSSVHGRVYSDEGYVAVTGTASGTMHALGEIGGVTAIKYKAEVLNTTVHAFCKAPPNEGNFSLNPTAFAPDNVTDWFLGSGFTASTDNSVYRSAFTVSGLNWTPYISHIGLYNDDNELLAVAKLSRPIRKPSDVPLSFHVQVDI